MLENALLRMEMSQVMYHHPNVLAAVKPGVLLLSLSEPCPGTGSLLLPGVCRQRCSKALWCSPCPRAACVCGRFL